MTEIFQTILSCHVSRPADSRVLRCQSRLTDQPAGAHLLPSPTNTRTSPNLLRHSLAHVNTGSTYHYLEMRAGDWLQISPGMF